MSRNTLQIYLSLQIYLKINTTIWSDVQPPSVGITLGYSLFLAPYMETIPRSRCLHGQSLLHTCLCSPFQLPLHPSKPYSLWPGLLYPFSLTPLLPLCSPPAIDPLRGGSTCIKFPKFPSVNKFSQFSFQIIEWNPSVCVHPVAMHIDHHPFWLKPNGGGRCVP